MADVLRGRSVPQDDVNGDSLTLWSTGELRGVFDAKEDLPVGVEGAVALLERTRLMTEGLSRFLTLRTPPLPALRHFLTLRSSRESLTVVESLKVVESLPDAQLSEPWMV